MQVKDIYTPLTGAEHIQPDIGLDPHKKDHIDQFIIFYEYYRKGRFIEKSEVFVHSLN